MIKIPDNINLKAKTLAQFCDDIFPGLQTRVQQGPRDQDQDLNLSRAIIGPSNADVKEINDLFIWVQSGDKRKSTDPVTGSGMLRLSTCFPQSS